MFELKISKRLIDSKIFNKSPLSNSNISVNLLFACQIIGLGYTLMGHRLECCRNEIAQCVKNHFSRKLVYMTINDAYICDKVLLGKGGDHWLDIYSRPVENDVVLKNGDICDICVATDCGIFTFGMRKIDDGTNKCVSEIIQIIDLDQEDYETHTHTCPDMFCDLFN